MPAEIADASGQAPPSHAIHAAIAHAEDQRAHPGKHADSPLKLNGRAWWAVLKRVYGKINRDNVSLLAAGVAFYAFLSIVPLLGAVVLTYGLVADPATVRDHMQVIIDVVPRDAAKLIYDQLLSVTTTSTGKTGLGLVLALLLAVYGATRASGAIMGALNIVYEEDEARSFLKTTATSFLIIIGLVLTGVIGMLMSSVLNFLGVFAGNYLPDAALGAIKLVTWAVAMALTTFVLAAVYRFGPSRRDARWRWLTTGSLLATLLWLLATIGFGYYASQFGNYNATYGALGSVVVLLMWLYVSAFAILLGAALNAEIERQTAHDTTVGPAKPMGERGATMADMTAA